jgi:hypothetical protein
MKNFEVLGNLKALSALDVRELVGVKLSYAYLQNLKKLTVEAETIQSCLKYSDDFVKFKERLLEGFKESAKTDENGEVLIIDGKYHLDPEKEKDFKEFELKQREIYKDVIEDAKKVEEEYNKFLEEDSEIVPIYVGLKDLSEKITPIQMNTMSFMIKEFVE